jgi:hypothetical protein
MRMLHDKIWSHSLPGFLSAEDSNLELLSIAYGRDTIALGRYGISGRISSMPRRHLNKAIACLQQMDADRECSRLPSYQYAEEDEEPFDFQPAYTPIEKLACVKTTLDLISHAAETYIKETSMEKAFDQGWCHTF